METFSFRNFQEKKTTNSKQDTGKKSKLFGAMKVKGKREKKKQKKKQCCKVKDEWWGKMERRMTKGKIYSHQFGVKDKQTTWTVFNELIPFFVISHKRSAFLRKIKSAFSRTNFGNFTFGSYNSQVKPEFLEFVLVNSMGFVRVQKQHHSVAVRFENARSWEWTPKNLQTGNECCITESAEVR